MKRKILIFGTLLLALGYVATVHRNYILGFYDGIEKYVFRCSDFGKNYTQIQNYLVENSQLDEIVEVGQEPGWSILVSSFIRINGTNNIPGNMFFFSMFVFLFTALFHGIFIKRITGSIFLGSLVTILILISFVQNMSHFGQVRQMLASLFLIVFLFIFFLLRSKVLAGLVLGMMLMSHRSLFGLIGGILACMFLFEIFLFKNKKHVLNDYITICIISGLASAPFLYFSLEDIRSNFNWITNIHSDLYLEAQIGGSRITQFGGYSNVKMAYRNTIPMQDLFESFPILILFGISTIKKNCKSKYFLYVVLGFLVGYCLKNRLFSHRILSTLDPYWIDAGIIGALHFYEKKILLIFSFFCILLTQMLHLSNRSFYEFFLINRNEESIHFAIQNIAKDDAVILGGYCMIDLFQQLGYKTQMNTHIFPIAHIQRTKTRGLFMTYGELWMFGEQYWRFLGKVSLLPLPTFLEGKKIYMIQGKKYWDTEAINFVENNRQNFKKQEIQIFQEFDDAKMINKFIYFSGPFQYFDTKNYYENILKGLTRK